MILLDTNIFSEGMRASPEPRVIAWLNDQDTRSVHVSSVTVGEICYGLAVMPAGRRRRFLESRFETVLQEGFAHRVLSLDEAAARLYGGIMSGRRSAGRPISVPDGQIAAIARANSCALATRNIRDFEDCGIDLINPFDA